jgi:hypothetical protein
MLKHYQKVIDALYQNPNPPHLAHKPPKAKL